MAPTKEWFLYEDRDNSIYNPTVSDMITTQKFWHKDRGNPDSQNWVSEEWFIISALVPKEQLSLAEEHLSNHHLDLKAGWHSINDGFDFGDRAIAGNINIYAWSFISKDPISGSIIIELRQDFKLYHLLKSSNNMEYYHPIDNIIVAETGIDLHEYHNPTPKIKVQIDYLRDYLAAREMGLIISIVADRFANIDNNDELDLKELNDELICDHTWITTTIHKANSNKSFHLVRSTLRRNVAIEPYEEPKIERSPWPHYGSQPNTDESPKFIINSEGHKACLTDHRCPAYLYFRPEVLQKYLRTPGYGVFFHMRNWGVVSFPNDGQNIDVGMNSKGLVNAFAPDIAQRNTAEQNYWSSYSSIPSGEICDELFQTRMQCNPPHSPGVIDLILEARNSLDIIFQEKLSCKAYSEFNPEYLQKCKISVGPVSNDFTELFELTKILYKWLIESMKVESLRKVIEGKIDYSKEWKQIVLLEKILKMNGADESLAKSLSDSLRGLNELRIADAHVSTDKLKIAFSLFRIDPIPDNPRLAWAACVDKVTSSIKRIADSF